MRVAAAVSVRRASVPPREHQVDVADRDGVAVVQHRRLDARTVDERAVDAAVVADLGAAGRGHQGRVVARRQHVGDDDVVVGGAADLDRARRRLAEPARPQDLQHARREVALARARGGRRPHRRHRLQRRRRHRLRHRRRAYRLWCARRIRRRADSVCWMRAGRASVGVAARTGISAAAATCSAAASAAAISAVPMSAVAMAAAARGPGGRPGRAGMGTDVVGVRPAAPWCRPTSKVSCGPSGLPMLSAGRPGCRRWAPAGR